MMNLNSCICTIDEFISNESQLMSVIVVQNGVDQRHCGIIYKFKGQNSVIHLAWHYNLQHELDMSKFQDYYSVKSQLDEYRQYALCAMCDVIKEDTNIPYAFYYQDTVFNEKGKLCLGKNEVGLTCATFVLAVFKSSSIEILDLLTWPSREDDTVFHRNILNYLNKEMERGIVSQKHFDSVKSENSCARFRPEEVAIGSGFSFERMPLCYDDLKELSIEIKNKLESNFTKRRL